MTQKKYYCVNLSAEDWQRIKPEYEAGIRSLESIAKEAGITHGALSRYAKRHGWQRSRLKPISTKIALERAAEAEALRQAEVTARDVTKVTPAEIHVTGKAADLQTEVLLRHRTDLRQFRDATMTLLGELMAASNADLQAALDAVLAARGQRLDPKAAAQLERAFDAIMSLPGRAAALQRLAQPFATLLERERQAVGLVNGDEGKNGGDILVLALTLINQQNREPRAVN